MIMKKIRLFTYLFFVLTFPLYAKLNVVVSIPPQVEFVKAIGQELVQVTCLLPPGASDELFEPTPDSLKALSQAQLYVQVGTLAFEKHYARTWQSLNPRMTMLNTSKGIQLMGQDPHVWMSLTNAKIQINAIYNALIAQDPSNQKKYLKNKTAYLQKLASIDQSLTKNLSQHPGKPFLIFHPALGYFSRDYGLKQIGIEAEGKSPTPKQLQQILMLAKKEKITLILVEKQSSKELAKLIADHIHGHIVVFDPLDEHYLKTLHLLMNELSK